MVRQPFPTLNNVNDYYPVFKEALERYEKRPKLVQHEGTLVLLRNIVNAMKP